MQHTVHFFYFYSPNMPVTFVSCINSPNSHRLIGPHTSCASVRLHQHIILKPLHNISVQQLSICRPVSAILPVTHFCALVYHVNNLR